MRRKALKILFLLVAAVTVLQTAGLEAAFCDDGCEAADCADCVDCAACLAAHPAVPAAAAEFGLAPREAASYFRPSFAFVPQNLPALFFRPPIAR